MSEETNEKNFEEEYYETEEQYYEKAFKQLDETGKHTWNWAACIFGCAWMAYRKMYLYAFLFIITFGVFKFSVCSIISFNFYGNFSSLYLLENEHSSLLIFVSVCLWIVNSIFAGYSGNALYYSAVKKRIQKGYHLLQKYRPISILSALAIIYSPFICFADWISRKSQLKTKIESEVDEETIRAYLNPYKKNHLSVKIANIFVCLLIIASIVRTGNNYYKEAATQVTIEKKIQFLMR